MRGTFQRIFMDRNFTLLLSSRFISQLGDKIFLPAILWLAVTYDEQGSTKLGIVSVAMVLPPLVSALIGVYVDRMERKKLMIVSDLLRVGLCAGLIVNGMMGQSFWVMVALIFLIELLGQFFTISSGSFVPQVVPEEKLVQANSLFTATENITSIIGYAGGGILIGLFGIELLIIWNGVSFLLSALLLLGLRVEEQEAARHVAEKSGFVREFLQGLRIVFLSRLMAALLLSALILNTATASLEMLITIWAHDVLALGAEGFGLLLTSILIGALLGSVVMNLGPVKKLSVQVLISGSTLLFGAMLILLTLYPHVVASVAIFLITGVFFSMTGISFSTLVMKFVPKEHLGKIFGIVQTVTRGGQPLGISAVTALLAIISPHAIIFAIGSIVVAGGVFLIFALYRQPESKTQTESM